jgi:putative glutathione S-transferase
MPSISHELTKDLCVKGRLVLYVGMFCPFATRVTIARSLKGLEDIVPIVKVNSVMDPSRKSWTFKRHALGSDQKEIGIAGDVPEPFYDAQDLRQLYERSEGKEEMEGPFVVPTLWDTKEEKIVNNESKSLLSQMSTCFNHLLEGEKAALNLYPESLQKEIDEWYEACQRDVYSGVYKAVSSLLKDLAALPLTPLSHRASRQSRPTTK